MPSSCHQLLTASLVAGLALFVTSSCSPHFGGDASGEADRALTVKGSDTMVHLVSAWAEAFMASHPETEISVTGGGSGTGFAALLNNTTDICAASRDMMPKEKELAEQRGMQPATFLVARDGIAIVVHPSNPVTALTKEQLAKIYSGSYDNWSQLGGLDRPIVVLSRDSSSGTFVFFQLQVLNKRDFHPDARLLPATSAIVQSVARDEGAIGYVGLGYAAGSHGSVKIVPIKRAAETPAVTPSVETVRSGEYPIARPLHLYTPGSPSGLAKDFVEFCLGQEGQAIVRNSGYVVAK